MNDTTAMTQLRTTEKRLIALSYRVLDAQIAAHRAGDMDRFAKAAELRRHIARRLDAISLADKPVLSVRQRWGGFTGAWRS